jgi:hypothetical protein
MASAIVKFKLNQQVARQCPPAVADVVGVQLWKAAKKGKAADVRRLVAAGAEIDSREVCNVRTGAPRCAAGLA